MVEKCVLRCEVLGWVFRVIFWMMVWYCLVCGNKVVCGGCLCLSGRRKCLCLSVCRS